MLVKPRSPYLLERAYLNPSWNIGLDRGLVHHGYMFEYGATKIRDLTGNNYTSGNPNYGTFQNPGTGVIWVPDRGGYVLKFVSASSGRVDWANFASLNFSSSDSFTVSCWMRTLSTSVGSNFPAIVAKNNAANSNATGFQIQLNTTTLGQAFWAVSDGTQSLTLSWTQFLVNDQKWHFIVCEVDRGAGLLKISVDGWSFATGSVGTLGSLVNSQSLRYGYRIDGSLGSNYYSGLLDDVRIWKRALSLGEINRLYRQKLLSRVPLEMRYAMGAGAVAPVARQYAVTVVS
jgi:hypothetical protein